MYILLKRTPYGDECYPFQWDSDAYLPDTDEIAEALEVDSCNPADEFILLDIDDNELRYPPTLRRMVVRED